MADWEHYEGKTWKQNYWGDVSPIPKPKPPIIPPSIPYKPDKDLVDAYQKFLDEMEEKEVKKKVPAWPDAYLPAKPKPKPKPKKKRKPKVEKIEPPPPHDDNIEERQV